MARTIDLSFLSSIKKEQTNSIIKQQHILTSTTFSFLFSDLIKKEEEEPQNPCSSSVLDHDDDDDDVCLHFSVGDPSCSSCDHQQQQLITNKKRKQHPQQQQLILKNKKPRWVCDDDDDHSICLHLMLGSSSCIPTCVLQTKNNVVAAAYDDDQWEIKKVLEQSDVCLHMCRLLLKNEVSQKFVIPFVLGGAADTEQVAQSKQGIHVQVRDVDTDTLHSLVFKIWVSGKMHNFTKRWVKDFVKRRELKKGDQIGLRWDQDNGRFDFSVIGRAKF